ncbi:MAG TPA: lactonase family protein [Streptosporangiaceae bacterium]|jgi:6-phosphogluconolactonase
MQLIIGTYTEQLVGVAGQADGILTAGFDGGSGRIGPVSTLATTRNPSYLAMPTGGQNLYAVNETLTFGGEEKGSGQARASGEAGGGITAYARDPGTGALTELATRPSLGPSPCHLALDRTGRFVLAANYGTGAGSVTVYPVAPGGGLGDVTSHIELTGSGPHPQRQASSHAHMIASDPVTGDIFVADLGSDTIGCYTLDPAGRLTARTGAQLTAAPGAGPRHLAFHPDGRHLFVVNELDNTVGTLRRDGARFTLTHLASTLPAGPGTADAGAGSGAGSSLAGAIRVSPSGRHVLVTNRGHDSVAVLRFDPGGPALSPAGHAASVGEFPRDLVVTPDGRHVIVACQNGSLLASFGFDDGTGALALRHTAAVPTPVCLLLA